jgi:protoheme IX farnesyltransferase
MNATFKNYVELIKFRLTTTVVATSSFGYLIALKYTKGTHWLDDFNWLLFIGVLVGGMFIVFAANGLNQIIEKENDGKMSRTSNRPIVEGRISVRDARVFCWITGFVGIFTLIAVGASFLSVLLGGLSLVIYVFVYTPMKQVSPMAVMIGAIPGALPPWIGYAAIVPRLDELGLILFLIQFFWQFPHFWAIAWMLHDDYQKAGYWLLPTKSGRDKRSAYQVLIYTVILILVSMMPLMYGIASIKAISVILPLGLFFLFKAYRLFVTLEVSEAKKLLYASFLYTPIVFLSYILF